MVALLGTGLFVQNLVAQTLSTMTLPDLSASLYIAQTYDIWYNGDSPGNERPVPGMIAAITNGFVQPFSDVGHPLSTADIMAGAFDCSSTNCSMGQYSSLGVCSGCVDVSDTVVTDEYYARLPNSTLSLQTSALLNVTSDTSYPDPGLFPDIDIGPLIVRYRALAWGFGDVAPSAVECVAYWCVSTYSGNIISGTLVEEVVRQETASSESSRNAWARGEDIVISLPQCWYDNLLYIDADVCIFRVAAQAQRAIQNFLTVGGFGSPAFLSGWQTQIGNTSFWHTTSYAAQMLGDPCTFMKKNVSECNQGLYAGLGSAFINMTAFMTQAVRAGNGGGYFWTYGNVTLTDYRFEIRYVRSAHTILCRRADVRK